MVQCRRTTWKVRKGLVWKMRDNPMWKVRKAGVEGEEGSNVEAVLCGRWGLILYGR